MKLKELKSVLYSHMGNIQWAIVWDTKTAQDIANGCSVDYAVAHYGECELVQIQAYENSLVLNIIAE